MAFENGINWKPTDPHLRGRHDSFASALTASVAALSVEHDVFFDSLVEKWPALFPDLPITPGRKENGMIFLYVRSAPILFSVRPRLPAIKRKLAALPGAPKRINLVLEIHK